MGLPGAGVPGAWRDSWLLEADSGREDGDCLLLGRFALAFVSAKTGSPRKDTKPSQILFLHPLVPTGLMYYKFSVLNKAFLGSHFANVFACGSRGTRRNLLILLGTDCERDSF